jgi:hypothetical protein
MGSCRTCRHSDRQRIDRAILARVPYRRIATQHGIAEASIRRHAARHLPSHLARAHAAEEASQASDLLSELRNLIERERQAETTADECGARAMMPGGHVRFALRAIDAAGRCRERQARWYSVLAELRGVKPGLAVTVAPELPLSPPRKLSVEEQMTLLRHMRAIGGILGREPPCWTDSTSPARPNGGATP